MLVWKFEFIEIWYFNWLYQKEIQAVLIILRFLYGVFPLTFCFLFDILPFFCSSNLFLLLFRQVLVTFVSIYLWFPDIFVAPESNLPLIILFAKSIFLQLLWFRLIKFCIWFSCLRSVAFSDVNLWLCSTKWLTPNFFKYLFWWFITFLLKCCYWNFWRLLIYVIIQPTFFNTFLWFLLSLIIVFTSHYNFLLFLYFSF